MNPVRPPTLAFDEVVIDFAGRRLLRAGTQVTLEPKAFDVLALLAGNPGQALTRDQILDAVWGHRHVTPGVLNRIVTLLRHALGEDAQTQRYVHTLHGIGYRFDLPAAPSEPAIAVSAASLGPGAPMPERRQSPPAVAKRRRPWRPVLAGVALLLALVAAGMAWLRPVSAPATTSAPAADTAPRPAADATLIVMPLKPIGEDPSDREIAAGLSDELITELAQIRGLRVIARESTGLAAAQSPDIAALVPRLNISHALEGSLRRSGEQLRVHTRLIEAGSGRTLWARDYDRPAADVLSLQRDIARAVATGLALELGLATGPVASGGDAEFLRRFFAARALIAMQTDRAGDRWERAESEFRALARLRPDDGRTHAALALALDDRAFVRPALAEQLRLEAVQEATLALRLDPNLADAHRVMATAACRASQWESCLERHRKASELAVGESRTHRQYAMELAALGYLDRAEAMMREGLRRDPLSVTWHFGHARILDTLGRHDEALAHHLPNTTTSPYGRWFNAAWRKDYAQAGAIAAAMGESEVPREYERMLKPAYVAVTRALVDPARWPEARKAMDRTEQASGLMNFLRVLDPAADPGKLVVQLEDTRKRSYSTWDLLLWTRDLAFLRRDPAFQDYLRRNGILAYWKRHGFPPQCRPTAQGADCD